MYESHITVEGYSDADFIEICRKIGVKPVIIDRDTGSSYKQAMTAKFHKTTLEQSLDEMHAIASNFDGVVRRKLEKIIGKSIDVLPPHLYLEFHTKYELAQVDEDLFLAAVAEVGGHSARNLVKPGMEETIYRFATARSRETYEVLLSRLNAFKKLNTIMECVVYDDNPKIDNKWYDCSECILKKI